MKQLTTIVLLLIFTTSYSQEVDISDFQISENRKVGEILHDRIPFGYYAISAKDNVNEKQSLFNLKVFDNENIEVSSIDFIEGNKTKILEAVFTGESLIFKIRRTSIFQNEIVFYELDLNHNFKKIEGYHSSEKVNKTYGLYSGLETLQGSLFNFNDGFLNYYMAREESRTFQIDYCNLKSTARWTYKPQVDEKNYKILNFLTKNDSLVVSLLSAYPGTSYDVIPQLDMEAFHNRKINQYLIINSISDGKQISILPMFDESYDYKVFNCQYDEKKHLIVSGLFYGNEGGIINSEAQGVIKLVFSPKGDLIFKNLLSFSSIFEGNFPISQYSELVDIGDLYIHNTFAKADGKLVLVAENILRTFEQKSRFKLQDVYLGPISKDLFLFEIDSTFEKTKIYHIEKYPVELDRPRGVISLNNTNEKQASYFKYTRQLDYIGTTISPDYQSYQILYHNKSKYEKVPEKFITCFANINGKIATDEYWLNEEKVTHKLLSFNFGKITVIVTNKKTKFGEIIQKKFNFQ